MDEAIGDSLKRGGGNVQAHLMIGKQKRKGSDFMKNADKKQHCAGDEKSDR